MTGCARRLLMAAVVALLGLFGTGCGSDSSGPVAETPLGEDLRAAAKITRQLLAEDSPPGSRETDVRTYIYLCRGLDHPDWRFQAEDSLFAMCDRDSANFLLMDVAVQKYRRLSRKDAYAALRARVESDTTSAAYLFLYARRMWGRDARGNEYFRNVKHRSDQFDPLQKIWLDYRIAGSAPRVGPDRIGLGAFANKVSEAWSVGGAPLATYWWSLVAVHLKSRGRLDDALVAVDLAQACAERSGSSYQLASIGLIRGQIQELHLAIDSAFDTYTSVYGQALADGNVRLARRAVAYLSDLERTQANPQRQRQLHQRFLDLATAAADSHAIVLARLAQAYDLLDAGLPDSAECYFNIAGRIDAQRLGRRTPQKIYYGLAHVAAIRGQYAKADSLWRKALQLEAGSGDEVDLLELQIELAELALASGQPGLAAQALARGAELESAVYALGIDRDPRIRLALVRSDFLERCGRFHEAAIALARAESLDAGQSVEANWQIATARTELEIQAGDLAEAEIWAQQALAAAIDLENATRERISRIQLGEILLANGRPAEAERLFDFDDEVENFWARTTGRMLWGIARADAGDHASALQAYAQVESMLDSASPDNIRCRLNLETGRSLVALGKPRAAAEAFARAQRILNSGTGVNLEEFASFNSHARRDLAENVAALCVDHPRSAVDGEPNLWSLRFAEEAKMGMLGDANVTAPPDDGSVAAVYLVGKDRAFVWVGANGDLQLRELPSTRDLSQLADGVMATAVHPTTTGDFAAVPEARQLASALLGDVIEVWRPDATLYLAPDAMLHDLPWAALPLPGDAAGKPLIERGALITIQGWSGFVAEDRDSTSSRRLLALGADGATLDQAEAEARAIATGWQLGPAVLRIGPEAIWNEARAHDLAAADVIHISTHARITAGLPGYSYLILGPERENHIALADIAKLRVGADLVFLSCCEAGRRGVSSGFDNFAQAFNRAGAQAIIASTIRIDDTAAAFLARSFYRHWQAGMSRAAALRAAQLETMQAESNWRHPAYWAFHRLFVK